MAVNIAAGQIFDDGGAIFETAGATKVAVFSTPGDEIAVYKDIDGTPSLIGIVQTSTLIHGGGNTSHIAAWIDSVDIVHVVAISSSVQTRSIAYNTISDPDGTPAWGTWEEAAPYTDGQPTQSRTVDIDLDSSDKPHTLFTDGHKVHGTTYGQIYYTEKTGASWSTPVAVSGGGTVDYGGCFLSLKASDNGEAVYYQSDNGDAYYNVLTSGSWGSEAAYTKTAANAQGVAVDTGGTVRRLHLSGTSGTTLKDLLESNSDVGYDTKNSVNVAPIRADIYLNGTDRYIFFTDVNDDIHLISNDGGGWTDEGVLQTGNFDGVLVGWGYNNLNNTATIDYLYDDGTDVFWDEFTLAGITTYFQSVAGAVGFAGNYSKLPKKKAYGAVGFAGDLSTSSLFHRAYAGAIGFAGDLAQSALFKRAYAGAIGFVGDLATQSRFSKALAGAISFSGDLATRGLFKRLLVASIGFDGQIAKKAQKTLSGGLSFVGGLAKQTSKSFVGALGFDGNLSTQSKFTKALAGAISFAGDLSKKSWMDLSGALGFGGALAKKSFLNLAGVLSFAGDLTPIKQLAIFFQSLAGSIGFSGDLSKKSFLDLSGVLGFAGDVVKKTSKNFAGALGFAGDLSKKSFISLAGTLTSAGTVVGVRLGVLYFQAVSGAIGFAGDLKKKTIKSLAGTLTSAGALAPSGRFKRLLSGTLTLTGDIKKKTLKALSGDLSFAGVLGALKAGVLFFKSLAGSVGFDGTLSTRATFKRLLTGTIGFSGDIVKKTSKTLSGALPMGGAIIKKTFKSLAGNLDLSGTLATIKTQFKSVSGSIGFSGAISSVLNPLLAVVAVALTLPARSYELTLNARDFGLNLGRRGFAFTLNVRGFILKLGQNVFNLNLKNRN